MTSSPAKILFSGASGMIGAALVRAAEARRIQTLQLVRRKPSKPTEISWDPQAGRPVEDVARLEGLAAAIHLSGANLSARRWTPPYKREIFDSRVNSTRALVKILKSLKQPPRMLLCASATGIYGNRGDEILSEESEPGQGFLAETCLTWEAEAALARSAGIRVVHLRFGVVISAEDGALRQMLPIFRLGLGGNLGSGKQWMSWIALSDLVRAVFYLLDSPAANAPHTNGPPIDDLSIGAPLIADPFIDGPFNLVAPHPVTNAEFTRALGRALYRPVLIPAPAFALRLAFGDMAGEALLSSTRAIPARLLRSGFTFELPDIASALNAALQSLHPDR
jgi:uncharacterized protein